MRNGAVLGAAIGAFIVGACSSFSGSSEATDPGLDGSVGNEGGPGSVSGQAPDGSVAIAVTTGNQTWVRNRSNTIEFTVARGPDVNGRVRVNIGGLPKGSAAPEVAVPPGETAGKMVFKPAAEVPTGDLKLTLDAVLDGSAATASLPVDGTLQGAPGDVDSAFGTSGSIAIAAKEVSAVASDGRIYVIRGDKTTERYTPGGQLDTTFAANGRGTYGNTLAPPTAVQVTATNIFVLFNPSAGPYRAVFSKSSLDGVFDTTFGLDGNGYPGVYSAFVRSSTGELMGVGTGQGCNAYCGGSVAWLTATGTSADQGDPNRNLPARLTAGALDGKGLLVVGENTLGSVVTGYQHYNSLQFLGGAPKTLASNISLFGIDLEGANILVSGIDTSTGAPFMAKFQPDGAGPFAGFDFSPAAVFFDPTFGTKSLLAADGTILHVGREKNAMTCALAHYTATGKVDTNFGTNGVARLPVTPCQPGGVYLQPDGKIIVDAGSLGTAPAVSSILRVWN